MPSARKLQGTVLLLCIGGQEPAASEGVTMVTDDLPRALDQLAAAGRAPGVGVRPVLLRVVVEMFADRPHHTAAEVRQFEEIVSHILNDAEPAARLELAAKLSRHPQTPKSLLNRLVAEWGSAAEPPVNGSEKAAPATAAALSTDLAVAAAEAPDLDETTVRALAERPESAVLQALVANAAAPIDVHTLRALARQARQNLALAAALLDRPGAEAEATGLFFAATQAQRVQIIADARRRELGITSRSLPVTVSVEALTAIERASKLPGLDGLDVALASLLGLSRADIDLIMDDDGGEPLALALASVGVSTETAGRIFILGNSSVGHSYERVKALVGIVESVSPRASFRLVMGMLGRSGEVLKRSALPSADAPARRSFGASFRPEATSTEPVLVRLAGRKR
jgi:Uncharacterised protein conserved in bacteria (DUF2336)